MSAVELFCHAAKLNVLFQCGITLMASPITEFDLMAISYAVILAKCLSCLRLLESKLKQSLGPAAKTPR